MLICGCRNLNYQGILCKRYRRVGAMPSQKIETGHQDVVHDVARDYFGRSIFWYDHQDYWCRQLFSSTPCDPELPSRFSLVDCIPWALVINTSQYWVAIKVQFGRLHIVISSCNCDGGVIICQEGNKPDEWTVAHVFTEQNSCVNSIAWEHLLHLYCRKWWWLGHHKDRVTSATWAPALAPCQCRTAWSSREACFWWLW